MSNQPGDDGSKKVKNIAAIIYLLVLSFLVGGSYLHQQAQANSTEIAVKVEQNQPWSAALKALSNWHYPATPVP